MLLAIFLRRLAFPAFLRKRLREREFDRVRTTMLSLLAPHVGEHISRTQQRVRFAQDMESLWFLRQDLVLVLAEFEGVDSARKQAAKVNGLFHGRLPVALEPRLHRRFSR